MKKTNEWTVYCRVSSKALKKRKQRATIYEAEIDCLSETLFQVWAKVEKEAKEAILAFEEINPHQK